MPQSEKQVKAKLQSDSGKKSEKRVPAPESLIKIPEGWKNWSTLSSFLFRSLKLHLINNKRSKKGPIKP